MAFVNHQSGVASFSQLFNEEHASQVVNEIGNRPFHCIRFKDVGIKIMKQTLLHYCEKNIDQIEINYNWNQIMVIPKLVCYDKNQWKTLQQLNNWNKEWHEIFLGYHELTNVSIKFVCSWADEEFVKIFLEGIMKLPNIQTVSVQFSSKNNKIEKVLQAVQQAKIFPNFAYKFTLFRE